MSSMLTSFLAFVVAISLLVAIHEFGHYIVGRWAGMKVLRFSIGFGSPLWSRRAGKDDTEYCIAAIPLGGYVRFLDSREGAVAPADQGRAFDQRPIPHRIAVLLAGPLFNFLFAILAYWVLLVPGEQGLAPVLGQIEAESYADQAGLRDGDRIIAVSGEPVNDWDSALLAILESMVATGQVPLLLENERGGQHRATLDVGDEASRLTEPGALFDGLGISVGQPFAVVGETTEDGAARAGGLREGDRITAVAGKPTTYWSELLTAVRGMPGERVDVEYLRDGNAYEVSLTLGETGSGDTRRGLLGVGLSESAVEHYYFDREYSIAGAFVAAIGETWEKTVFTVRMLGRMVTGDVSIKNISGPINIAQFAGESAERGITVFIGFLAIISISLGVLNLLPVPVLDGGQIVFQLAEALKGSPLTERAQIVGQQIGLVALLLLMSFAFYNDIARILE